MPNEKNVATYRLQFPVDQALKESAFYTVVCQKGLAVQLRPFHPDISPFLLASSLSVILVFVSLSPCPTSVTLT